MGKHLTKKLHTLRHIISSDEDQPIVIDIYAGFTEHLELAIAVEYYNYDEQKYNRSTAAIVKKEDAQRMARRHNVEYHELPQFISECMEEWRQIINPTTRQVNECFKEITECLLDEGCRFKIIHSYGHHDLI